MARANDAARRYAEREREALVALSRRTANKVRATLRATERRLLQQLLERARRAERLGYDTGPETTRFLREQLRWIGEMLGRSYEQAHILTRESLREIAALQADKAAAMVRAGLPDRVAAGLFGDGFGAAGVVWTPPSTAALAAIVTSEAFDGRLLRDHFARQPARVVARLRRELRIGNAAGWGAEKMAREMAATVTGYNRVQLRGLVRTATMSTAQGARARAFQGNEDILDGYTWLGTLDLRTTLTCIVRDQLPYTLDFQPEGHFHEWGDGPGAIHYNCRSTFSPRLKSWAAMGIRGNELSRTERRTMDGLVTVEGRGADWLAGRKGEDLIRALGPKRAAMVADGFPLDRLVAPDGRIYRLEELAGAA